MARVILFFEERSVAEVLARTLQVHGHFAEIGEAGKDTSPSRSTAKFDVVVVEAIGAGVSAEREVARMRAVCPRTKVIVIGDETLPFSHLPLPLIAHRVGAKSTLVWPFHPGEFIATIDEALENKPRGTRNTKAPSRRARQKGLSV